jgi:methylmalonyl-CoA mutase
MRRVMQASGAEVIHLGHDRSVQEVVDCAIQEDANAIAMTSLSRRPCRIFEIHV